MNKSIRLTAIFGLVLTVILQVNLTIIHAFSDEKYAHNPLNKRAFYELQTTPRGQISAGGQVLAQSTENEDGTYSRSYPSTSPAFGPVTGYISEIYGASHLEHSYNEMLNGTDPALLTSNWLQQLSGKRPDGANLELTLDSQLQQYTYDQFTNQGFQGAAAAIRPSTGEVLALTSSPGFDPSGISNTATAEDSWAKVTNTPGNALLNHATAETLPPGSIFKIVTTAAGLEAGYNPESPVTGAAEITLPNTETQLTNYDAQVCGGSQTVTLRTAFSLSCNTAFVEMGIKAGADKLREAAEGFGIGERYDLGVDAASGSLGDLPDDAAIGQSSIGQRDVTMSALQAAVMAGTVANKGERMQPYLVSKITNSELKTVKETKPTVASNEVDEATAETLSSLMRSSEENTAGYDGNGFHSKTGTAEHGEGLPPHTWYVAFDPAKDIAIAVVVKDGGNFGEAATGGRVAAPIGRGMLREFGGGN